MKFKPEILVDKFFKSASRGKRLSTRWSRIISLIAIPMWIGSIVIVSVSFYQAIKAIPKYNTLQQFKKSGYDRENDDQNCYGGHVHENWRKDGESLHQCGCFDSQFWRNMGVTNPDHMDSVSSLFSIAESRQIADLLLFFSLLYVPILLYVLPWIIIRVVYWIVSAENKSVEHRT
jgi:hypothetical protein